MSEIKVDKISPQSGTALAVGDSGDTITIPSGATITNSGTATGFGGGKILQVLSETKTDLFTSTSLSFVNITDLSITITPATTGSRFLILGMVHSQGNTGTGVSYIRLAVGGAALCIGDASGSKDRVSGSYFGTNNTTAECSIKFLHSPASVSDQVYSIQHASGGSYTTYVNRCANDVDAAGTPRTASTITVMEIGA